MGGNATIQVNDHTLGALQSHLISFPTLPHVWGIPCLCGWAAMFRGMSTMPAIFTRW